MHRSIGSSTYLLTAETRDIPTVENVYRLMSAHEEKLSTE